MAVPSRSGFKVAVGSFADIVTTVGAMPVTYIALFLIGAAQAVVHLSGDKTGKLTGEYTTNMLIADLAGFALALLLIPCGVGLLRHFTRAAPSYPSSLVMICLRVLGWTILLGVLYMIAVMALAIASGIVASLGLDMSALVAMGLVLLVVIAVLIWIGLRLALFYPIIARGEPSPLFGSFRQTKGSAFFVFRTLFFAALIGILLGAAAIVIEFALFGISIANFQADNVAEMLQPMLEPQPLDRLAIFAVFGGLVTIIGPVFYAALQGRIFRAIRGID